MKKNRVLFLEDEPTIREVLKEYMIISDYDVTEVDNGDEAIKLLEENNYDMAVLDIMVPGTDGFGVLEYIHRQKPQIATIMLTALEDEKTQLRAFNLYADDYVIKPVSPIILLKRMATILRRIKTQESWEQKETEVNPSEMKELGLRLLEESYSALYDGEPLHLTLSEYLLLHTLYLEPKRVFNREQLILRIYNEDYIGNDRIIDAHIKNLRKKLPVNCIKTVIGVGYQYEENDKS